MNEKPTNQDKLRSILRHIDDQRIKIREKQDIVSSEIMDPTPEEIYDQLQKGICTLFFYKMTDGTARRMRCTLQQSYFSKKYRTNKSVRKVIKENFENGKHGKHGLVPVWDMDHNGWKSFYLNRVYRLVRDEQTDAE